MGLMRLSMLSMMSLFDQICDYYYDGTISFSTGTPEPLSFDGIGLSLVYLACETVIYLLIAILLDYATNSIRVKMYFSRRDINVNRSKEVDSDVQAEEDRVMRSDPKTTDDVIQLRRLRKVYNGEKVAVDRITFGLQRGQCFGLLGINGAGKTTTFSMISGENAPTKGTAVLCGMDMIEEPVKVRRLLGMCPQSHALLDLLTVREHLELFGRIKGVPEEALRLVRLLPRLEGAAWSSDKERGLAYKLYEMLDAYPNLRAMYTPGDGNTMIFALTQATATFSSFTEASRTVTF